MVSLAVAKAATLGVVVPLSVFTANWVHRSNKGYPQTAAADFLLGVLIFDASVVLATSDFSPFVQSGYLREMIGYWHFVIAFISGLVWLAIVKWGEPVFERYYGTAKEAGRRRFPIFTFLACWFPVLVLVAAHVGFFALKVPEITHV